MKQHKSVIRSIMAAFPIALAIVFCSVFFIFSGDAIPLLVGGETAQKLDGVAYEIMDEGKNAITLPAVLKDLPPRTPVTLYAQIPPGHDSLFVKSVFAETILYFNDTPVYKFGQTGSYPGFMIDPPTGLAIVSLPENREGIFLKLLYFSPSQRSELSLPALYVGSEGALIAMLIRSGGFSLLFSLILIFTGLAMVLISLTFARKIAGGMSFLWLGLFSLFSGIWVMGECDLSAFLIPYPSLCYAMTYLGLFSVTIPFLLFGMTVLKLNNKRPILVMLYTHYIALTAALLLQFAGVLDFMKMLRCFHIIAPLSFIVFAANLLWEYSRYGNTAAKRFAPAAILLTSSVILELINYWLKLTEVFTTIFQIGVTAFIIALGVESGRYMREAMKTAAEKLRLEYEMNAAKDRAQRLSVENASLDRINRLKTELIETISHEAHTPLAVLSSYAGLVSMELKSKGVDKQTAADLDKIVFEAKRVANLINNMKKRALSRDESAKRVRLDICEAVRQTAELYRHILARNGVSLTLKSEENIPPVFGNPEELTQVLLNLLQNAKKHIEQGNVTIVVKNKGEDVSITVRDTGAGIDPVLLPHVFERGVSGGDGAGIGLAVCREIVESHGGTIEIHSNQNTGTEVNLTLPIYKGDDANGK